MIEAPIGFAFGAGAVAAFNPCGFALLPAYLGLFLTAADEDGERGAAEVPVAARLVRAAGVATAVVAGFVAVFGLAGLLIARTAVTVQNYTPWITLVIGSALIPAGIAMLCGWTPKLRLPRIGRAGKGSGPAAMFWFGVSYATVSLSCTIPAFLVAVVTTFTEDGTAAGAVVFLAYTAGMASVLVLVTVAVATARAGLLAGMRRVLPWVNSAAGVLAVLAGAYVAWYGWYEIRVNAGGDPPEGPIRLVAETSGTVTGWVEALPAPALLGAGLAVSAALLAVAIRRTRHRTGHGPAAAEISRSTHT